MKDKLKKSRGIFEGFLNEAPKKLKPTELKEPTSFKMPDEMPDEFNMPSVAKNKNTPTTKDIFNKPLSKRTAQDKMSQIELAPQAHDIMNQFSDLVNVDNTDLMNVDDEEDEIGIGFEDDPDNLPALIHDELVSYDDVNLSALLNMDWIKLSHTPNFNAEAIQQVFGPFFNHIFGVSMEDIYVATSLMPGTLEKSMQVFWKFLEKYAVKEQDMTLEIPNLDQYKVDDAAVYSLDGIVYFIMHENITDTTYVYVAKGRGTKIGGPAKSSKQIS